MRKMFLMSTALTLGALSPALAGGPVIVEEEVTVVETQPASSGGLLIPLLLLVAIAAVATGGDDAPPVNESDIRLKTDIHRVGTNRLRLGVYQYRYRGLPGVYEGVMAQEVQVMHPGAIRLRPGGYLAVDYARLGLEMKRVA